jgi:hypothetical protein
MVFKSFLLALVVMATIKAEIPESLDFLFAPSRYKVAHGGRGGSKSWGFARALLIKATQSPTRILCTREIQNSIKESVHKLLSDQIAILGLEGLYDVTDTSIRCRNGSEFIFMGLFRNVNKIKSLEGIDVVWVEEAESVSEESWNLLIPTIRKPNSEIWVSFNPKYPDDPTYKRFVIAPPAGAVVRQINYCDNPYFPEVLRLEMEADKAFRPHMYKHIWLGEPLGLGRKIWPDYIDEEYPKGHVRTFDWKMVAERANCFMVMDPAQHYYPACMWVALIPRNARCDSFYKWVYAEWPEYGTFSQYFCDVRQKVLFTGSLLDIAREVLVRDGQEHGLTVQQRFIDTRFVKGTGSANYWSGSTDGLVQEFAKKDNGGLYFQQPAEKLIDSAKNQIRLDLQYNAALPIGPYNEPSYYVAPWCRNVRDAMLNHRLCETSETEDSKRKDFSDDNKILYAGLASWTYKDPAQKGVKAPALHFDRSPGGWMG